MQGGRRGWSAHLQARDGTALQGHLCPEAHGPACERGARLGLGGQGRAVCGLRGLRVLGLVSVLKGTVLYFQVVFLLKNSPNSQNYGGVGGTSVL